MPELAYFKDVAIERKHYMAKSGVLSQTITTTMHVTTHIDAPAHVVQGTPFIDEVPLPHFFGSGLVVSIPKKKWESITGDDLEKACGHAIRKGDVLIINTGWHKEYEDGDYFPYCPGLVQSAADWMVEKGVKVVGHDTHTTTHLPLQLVHSVTARSCRTLKKSTKNGPAATTGKMTSQSGNRFITPCSLTVSSALKTLVVIWIASRASA